MEIARELTEWLGCICEFKPEAREDNKHACLKCGDVLTSFHGCYPTSPRIKRFTTANDTRLLTDKIVNIDLDGDFEGWFAQDNEANMRLGYNLGGWVRLSPFKQATEIHKFLLTIPVASGGLAK